MPKASKTRVTENSQRTAFMIFVNVVLIAQAVIFHWQLGTMVWIYFVQGLAIILLGIIMSKNRFAWVMLLGIMAAFGLLLTTQTIPSDDMTYLKNGVEVTAEEFIVFKDVNWSYVLLNAVLISVLQLYGYFKNGNHKQQIISSWEVVERLVPLHLTILLAGTGILPVVGFMVLKSFTDLVSDAIVRKIIIK